MGNLDSILFSEKGEAKAIIEFQTTIKSSVQDHCNNTFFLPKGGRKGDEQRWRVVHCLSKQSGLPIIILVWSPKEIGGHIKYKVVGEIRYSEDSTNPGLLYKEKKLLSIDEVIGNLKSL
jgi:hypothetical protein